eukprot:Gb_37933 [translate_table: standard]
METQKVGIQCEKGNRHDVVLECEVVTCWLASSWIERQSRSPWRSSQKEIRPGDRGSVQIMGGAVRRTSISNAYPIFAQQGYENPREATERIVCANCHLAKKLVDIEVPQSVLPDTVFESVVKIPCDMQMKQVIANGKKGLKRDLKLHRRRRKAVEIY